ncbi:MAG TPA: cytidylate kinase-like family protein [Chthoniobacterales bacterium]
MKPSLFDKCQTYLLAQATIPPVLPSEPPRAVTISRETGAGAVTIGQLVADYLQTRQQEGRSPWTVFDRNLVEKVLDDHGLQKTLTEYMPEDTAPPVRSVMEEILGVHPASWTLVDDTSRTIFKLASIGNVILVGRGSHLITAHLKHVFHVRLIAPLEQRIANVETYYGLNHDDAVHFTHKTDRARARYVREHFKSDVSDPLHYHLTINTGRLSFNETARLIGDAVLNM